MSQGFKLTLRDVTLRAVSVPLKRPLVTRVVTIERAALLLIDLETEEGVTGRTYLFGYLPRGPAYLAPLIRDLVDRFKGRPLAPATMFAEGRKALTLMGHEGLALMAVSGFDMAAWDALARAAGMPLVRLLGGEPCAVPAYNSNGLGLAPPEQLGDEAAELVAEGGFDMVKLRMGRDTLDEDLAALRAVRRIIGDQVRLPVDFNQGLSVDEAIRRGRALDGEGIYWIEEPIVYDDLAATARIAAEVTTPIQIGENFYGPKAMAAAIAAGAADYVMPDAQRIGGVTGWLQAAPLAAEAGLPMSSHLFPEVSCHLLAVTTGAHWLEFVDWAAPVLAEPLAASGGRVQIPDRPGSGVDWDEDAVAHYSVEI